MKQYLSAGMVEHKLHEVLTLFALGAAVCPVRKGFDPEKEGGNSYADH